MSVTIFTIKASELSSRWDVSFHQLSHLALPCRTKRLGKIARLKQGISVPQSRSTDSLETKGLLYIRISDLSNGQIFGKTAKRIPARFYRAFLKDGDILLSIRGSIGKTALVTESFEGSVPSSQLVVIRPITNLVNKHYLLKILSSEVIQQQLEYLTLGSTIQYITMSSLRRLQIPLPPIPKQARIVRKIEEIENRYKRKVGEKEKIRKIINKVFEDDLY